MEDLKRACGPDEASCSGCGKIAPCDGDYEEPIGWWSLCATRGLPTGDAVEDVAIVCSPACAARWLSLWPHAPRRV